MKVVFRSQNGAPASHRTKKVGKSGAVKSGSKTFKILEIKETMSSLLGTLSNEFNLAACLPSLGQKKWNNLLLKMSCHLLK